MADTSAKGKPRYGYRAGGAKLGAKAGCASTDPANVGVTRCWLACS
jgi:hypothetical protein